jgi:hypothetical protein
MITAELHDGRRLEFPDGTDPAVVQATVKRVLGSATEQPRDELFSEKLGRGVLNAGAGAIRGAGSIGATILAPYDVARDALAGKGLSLESNRQRREDMTEALGSMGADTDSLAFGAGKLGGEIAGTLGVGGALANAGARVLPAGAAPLLDAVRTAGFSAGGVGGKAGIGLRAAGGGITGAASAGLVNPEDAAMGAGIGAVAPSAVQLGGMVGRGVGRMAGPNIDNLALADAAINKYKIPLGMADISGSNTTKAVRSVLNDAPFTGGIGARQRDAVQGGFNRAIGETFGESAEKLTPEVLDVAKKRMGKEFDRIWSRNTLQFDADLFKKMQELRTSAGKLPQGDQARMMSWLDDFESRMVAGPNGELIMPGDVANRLQSKLREQSTKATGFLADDLQNLRRSILDAFKRSVSADDAAALGKNMGQYKAFKTVEPLLTGAEAGVAGRAVGDVPAALLPQAVRKSYGSNIANSPFSDLSQIGSQFVADRVARTGGSTRAAIQNTALGAALMGAGTVNPALAAGAIPLGMGGQAILGSPGLARAAVAAAQQNNGLLQRLPIDDLIRFGLLSAPTALSGQ